MKALIQALAATAVLLTASGMGALAQESGAIAVEDAWSRATPPGARVGVGYLRMVNTGPEADRLVGASSPRSRSVEIHSMSVADGIMRMQPASDGVEVPAGGEAALAPGGYHLMLIEIGEPLAEGERVPVTLRFEAAGEVETELAVGSLGARGPAEVSSHDGHSGH